MPGFDPHAPIVFRNPGAASVRGRRDVAVAAALSLLVNALVACALLFPPYTPPEASEDVVLVVDFLSIARAVQAPLAPADPVASALPAGRPATVDPARASVAVRHADPAAPDPPRRAAGASQATPPSLAETPMSAVFLKQARDWADRHPLAPREDDPFAGPPSPPAGEQPPAFRMREPPSPARVVAAIGVLFGADGTDGCTGIEDRIAGYAASGDDPAALRNALEYEKRLCRP